MDETKEYQDFKNYLAIQNNKVKNNTTEVKADELFPFMLHIDKKAPVKFIPMMPRRAAPSEDNTIPRVTVADTIIGCIMGYANSVYDFYDTKDEAGYYISKIKFNYCLQPNNKLVYDAEKTGEHWLIGYNKESLSYKTEQIGKIFLNKIITTKRNVKNGKPQDKYPHLDELIIYIELQEKIKLNYNEYLDKGYYRLNLMNDFIYNETYKSKNNYIIQSISLKEYMEAKNISATMLSRDSVLTKW